METLQINTHHNVAADYELAWSGAELYIFFGLYILPSWLYWLLTEWLLKGQTIGKVALGIRVVKVNGAAPGFFDFMLRWLLVPLDYGSYGTVALVSILATRKNQRLGDLLAGTVVIKAAKKTAGDVRRSMLFQHIEADYQPTYREARSLTVAELQLIKRALQAYDRNYHIKPIEKLARRISNRLQVEPESSPRKFLRTLVKDYQFFQSDQEKPANTTRI